MKTPIHMISSPASRWTPERIAGAGFVGVVHAIVIWAIVAGLMPKIVKTVVPPDIVLTFPETHEPPPPPMPAMPTVDLPVTSTTIAVPPPRFTIQQDAAQREGASTTIPTPPSVPDVSASAIVNTHTIPDYPPIARKLGEQGSVRLALTIAADGNVVAADVVQSSGFADLDSTAVAWVVSHWKYKPATRGGVAVASQAQAVVVFNLKNAR